jgi:hypothetical protein
MQNHAGQKKSTKRRAQKCTRQKFLMDIWRLTLLFSFLIFIFYDLQAPPSLQQLTSVIL